MRQFLVHRNCNAATRGAYPLLLNVQSDLIQAMGTRVVVPLAACVGNDAPAMVGLMPVLDVGGEPHVLVVPLLAAVETSDLGAVEDDLAHQRAAIMAALDLLISGI